MILFIRSLAAVAALLVGTSAWSATLQVDGGGVLTGALGVEVNGTLYNVSFADGSCADLFSGCDESADFLFTNSTDALAAAQALIDQVFVDGPAGSFDSDTTKTCGDPHQCYTHIPFAVLEGGLVDNAHALNWSSGLLTDAPGTGPVSILRDFSLYPSDHYAIFSSTVPVPPAVWLFGSALGLLGWMRGKNQP